MWTHENEPSAVEFQSPADRAAYIALQLLSCEYVFLLPFSLMRLHPSLPLGDSWSSASSSHPMIFPSLRDPMPHSQPPLEAFTTKVPAHQTLLIKHGFILQALKTQLREPFIGNPASLLVTAARDQSHLVVLSRTRNSRQILFLHEAPWEREGKPFLSKFGTWISRAYNRESNVLGCLTWPDPWNHKKEKNSV